MATLYPVDGTEPHEVPAPKKLKEYQALVGGLIEFIRLDDGRNIMVNEEGKLCGLPVNERATLLWYEAEPAARGFDVIVGPAVVFTPDEVRAMMMEG